MEVFLEKCFLQNRSYLYDGEFTASSDENNYNGSDNYLTEDGLAGFSISKSGWLVSLFSNYDYGGFAKSIKKHITDNANKLVCIVTGEYKENKIVDMYKNIYGFNVYAKTRNDTEIMRKYYGDEFVDSIISNKGIPYHVFMVRGNLEENHEVMEFDDYFEAESYVDNIIYKY